jgi:DNA-binding NtrC family response regulator
MRYTSPNAAVGLTAKSSVGASGPLSALVVDADIRDKLFAVRTLSAAGFHVTTADAFEPAKTRLAARPPSVLITALKLGEYNGLHLVMRAKAVHPDMAALVTTDVQDVVLQREADLLGATYVVQPVTPSELLVAVLRTLFRDSTEHSPIRPPFERRATDRRTALGLREPDRRASQRRRDLSALLHAAVVLS